MRPNGFAYILLLIPAAVVLALLLIGFQYFKGNFEVNVKNNSQEQNSSLNNQTSQSKETGTEVEKKEEPSFCAKYGTANVQKSDLLEEYLVGPGETMRDIARKKLNDESRALDLIKVNPQLSNYEIDDELPMRMKVYIPNEKYSEEGITAYIKTRGNITFNKNKPMFGVNAPNSGTGPFIISENIKDDLKNIKEGDCVEVTYGSKGYDPQKVVFEVVAQ